ncbi:MAG: aminotransferase class I/II-fold pyridoxal phosphate-dependent enzyme [Deltaproteobacteria bacterium]|nr:aminotransferase class I/II-fold pyridoxal phosphate-dependent enzyme [Deltaproteobacteria bacterium]
MAIVPNPAVAQSAAYAVAKHGAPIDLKLDANEGAPPPVELLALLDDAELLRRYPDARPLEAKLAARLGVTPDRVLATCGADDALDRACRAFLWRGRELVLPVPTFEMLPRFAELLGATTRKIPWPSGDYPLAEVLAAVNDDTAAIAVVSPNNPTGAVITREQLLALAKAVPEVMLFVDLAYAEYADDDLTDVALGLPNAVVFRTLSKAWGLAGARVGYAVATPQVIGWMRATGGPYAVTAPSVALACAWLERGEEAMRSAVARARSERTRLRGRLDGLGARSLPSEANFVIARPRDARWLRDGLAGLGVAVRSWPGHPDLDGLVRIGCPANEAQFDRLCAALDATLAPEALLFDMDGVLASVSGSYRQAILDTAASFGVTLGHGDLSRAKAAGNANNDWVLTQRLVEARGVPAPFDEVKARFEARYHGADGEPGLSARETMLCTEALLARLAQRLPLGIVTGRPRRDATEFLERHGIAHHFRSVVCMEDAPLKPDPAPVRRALAELGITRAWLVGDTPDDVWASRAAGVVPLGFLGGEADREPDGPATHALHRAGAARILASLDELELLLS